MQNNCMYFYLICDIMFKRNYQGLGLGSIAIKETIDWHKTIEDDDTSLYVNTSKNKENFYEKFGFVARPIADVGAGMEWYGVRINKGFM